MGDYWTLPDGTRERILEVADEDRHRLVLSNEYARVLKVEFPPGDTPGARRPAEDSVYFFLTEGGLNVINHVRGSDPACDCMEFGEVRYLLVFFSDVGWICFLRTRAGGRSCQVELAAVGAEQP